MTDQQGPSNKRTRQRRRSTGDRPLGDRIRKFRTRINLSQESTAHQIGRSEGWLLQVENGRTDPGYVDLLLLASVFKAHISELLPDRPATVSAHSMSTELGTERESMVACEVDSEVEKAVNRRQFNKGMVGSLFGVPAFLDWERADATLKHDRDPDQQLLGRVHVLVSALTTTTSRQLDNGSPELLAPMLQGAVTFVQSLFRGHNCPLTLAKAMSRLALLYGWLSFQLDNKSEARRIYRLAANTARGAGLTDHEAAVLAAASQLDSTIPYGGYQSSNVALVTINRADGLLGGGTRAPILQAWILARRAQECAALGDSRAAQRDLSSARHQFQPSAVTSETFYAYPNEGWITGYEASCHRLMQHWPEAEAAYTRVLATPSSPLWRTVTMSSLASVQARQGDADRAAGTLRRAVSLAIETNIPLRIRHIYGARTQLDRFRQTPAVQELDHFLSQVTQV